ncbi:MAG: DUF1565 domain-containing protein, partial [Actinomycetia bacterium]|nr:DUF1565 domain-containing protein [Actinomycetes bacterium]
MTSGTLIAGDTVTVASGTYDAALGEVFPIGFVDGVSLSGPGDGSASVEFSGVDAIAIDPTTGTSSVEGLRFVAGGTTQVSALLASATASGGGLHVLDNTFSAAGDHRFVALGDLPDTLIVDGNEATTLGNLVRCVVPSSTFAAASITISSNTMNGGDGVYLQLGSGAVATQVLISGNMAFGPELRLDCRGDAQVSGFLVSGNTCTAPASGSTIASGIRLTATSSAQLLDPTITGNILMDEGDIEVSVEDAAVVSGLTVSGNTLSGGTFNDNGGGISIELSETATVANLTVSDNLLMHGGDLACFFGYPDVVATDPVIHNNTLSGGNGINGGDLNLTISHSNYYGTSLNIVTNLTVTDNTLTPGATTVGAGLLYLGQLYGARANGTISGNSITGAADSGVYILRSSGEYGPSVCDFVFENNTVTGSGTDGFTIDLTQEESTGVVDLSYVLRGNTITDSVEHGIDMEFTQYEDSATVDFVLENNTITGNGSHGFWFTIDNFSKSTGTGSVADFDLTLVGNTISNNDGNGLRLSADADPNSNQVDFEIDARFNAFKDNGGAGVILAVEANPVGTNDVHATFDSNSIRDNTVEGLRFEHLFHPATFDIPNLTLSGCNTISGNGTNMDVVLALPMTGAPTFSHVTVDAT